MEEVREQLQKRGVNLVAASDKESEFLRKTCHDILRAGTEFPGPMAVNFMRRNFSECANQPYWITEKSDGIRVMMIHCNIRPRAPHPCFQTYFFDRTFQFYRLEEHIFLPCPPTVRGDNPAAWAMRQQDIVILDGEVVYNLRFKQPAYMVYDVVAACPEKPDRFMPFMSRPMGERVEAIRKLIIEPHWKLFTVMPNKYKKPKGMLLLAKHFYKKSQFQGVLDAIKPAPGGGYTYRDWNANDGIILTPEKYPFRPSTCHSLMKWKYPEKLTVDFFVSLAEPGASGKNSIVPVSKRKYKLLFLGHGGELEVCEEETQFVNHAELPPDVVYALLALARGDVSEAGVVERSGYLGVILECVLKFGDNPGWAALLHRADKHHPNGFKTVSATLENQCEHITTAEIAHRFGRADGDAEFQSWYSSAKSGIYSRLQELGSVWFTVSIPNRGPKATGADKPPERVVSDDETEFEMSLRRQLAHGFDKYTMVSLPLHDNDFGTTRRELLEALKPHGGRRGRVGAECVLNPWRGGWHVLQVAPNIDADVVSTSFDLLQALQSTYFQLQTPEADSQGDPFYEGLPLPAWAVDGQAGAGAGCAPKGIAQPPPVHLFGGLTESEAEHALGRDWPDFVQYAKECRGKQVVSVVPPPSASSIAFEQHSAYAMDHPMEREPRMETYSAPRSPNLTNDDTAEDSEMLALRGATSPNISPSERDSQTNDLPLTDLEPPSSPPGSPSPNVRPGVRMDPENAYTTRGECVGGRMGPVSPNLVPAEPEDNELPLTDMEPPSSPPPSAEPPSSPPP
eukprot:Rmarinus@m.118